MGRGMDPQASVLSPGQAPPGRNGGQESSPLTTQEASDLALDHVKKAHSRGTFGVGGVLIDRKTGRAIDSIENRVIMPLENNEEHTHAAHDPTAHGERQLITRYFQRIADGEDLPPPEDITIVTSLEPCAMCSGAIMTAGFSVGIVALDETAGLGVGRDRFNTLPQEIQDRASESFAYYEIEGQREFSGPSHIVHDGGSVSPEIHDQCAGIFIQSLDGAMKTVSGGGEPPKKDPSSLEERDQLRKAVVDRLPYAFSIKLDDPDQPNEEVLALLKELAEDPNGSGTSAVLVDPYGNVLLASGGKAEDPTATGMIDVIRKYSALRFDMANNPDLWKESLAALTHPKFATIYRYPPPDPSNPVTLLELGAYGSTMEGPLPESEHAKLHFLGEGIDAKGVSESIASVVKGMPLFYDEIVGVRVKATSF